MWWGGNSSLFRGPPPRHPQERKRRRAPVSGGVTKRRGNERKEKVTQDSPNLFLSLFYFMTHEEGTHKSAGQPKEFLSISVSPTLLARLCPSLKIEIALDGRTDGQKTVAVALALLPISTEGADNERGLPKLFPTLLSLSPSLPLLFFFSSSLAGSSKCRVSFEGVERTSPARERERRLGPCHMVRRPVSQPVMPYRLLLRQQQCGNTQNEIEREKRKKLNHLLFVVRFRDAWFRDDFAGIDVSRCQIGELVHSCKSTL